MERSGTVDKAVRVLEALYRASCPLSLAELAGRVRMPKPTLHRLLASLLVHDLVEQDAEGRYGLGVGLVRLGLGALAVDPSCAWRGPSSSAPRVVSARRSFWWARALAGWSCSTRWKAQGCCARRPAWVPRCLSKLPPAAGSIWASSRGSARDRALGQGFAPRRGSAVARGYDVNRGEWIAGLSVVAAPVIARGRMHGTVACAAVEAQLDEARLARRSTHARGGRAGVAEHWMEHELRCAGQRARSEGAP